jgi:transcriptional regulator with XRE-family HTH domain
MPAHSTTKRPPAVQAARNALRDKGWKHADVARQLGVTPVHLSYVLTGRRESQRILTAIADLPKNPNPA